MPRQIKSLCKFALLAALVLNLHFAHGTNALTYPLSMDKFSIRDPWIVAYVPTHTYYLYASNIAVETGSHRAGVMVYTSRDLHSWNKPRLVFSVPDGTWADPYQAAWAPEVHEFLGKFYLFVTLHNPGKVIARPSSILKTTFMRGTVIAVSDRPDGPFHLLTRETPIAPADFMSIDGTLYVDTSGHPWMVYAHEWTQKIDGTIEAVPLKEDLSGVAATPIFLFKGSDAPWLDSTLHADNRENTYVTDGPELFRTQNGSLLMLWSSFAPSGYVEAVARSRSGQIQGPWEQLSPLYQKDGGHGMLFRSFEGQLMLVLHSTNHDPHGHLFVIADCGDHLKILREAKELDGS